MREIVFVVLKTGTGGPFERGIDPVRCAPEIERDSFFCLILVTCIITSSKIERLIY